MMSNKSDRKEYIDLFKSFGILLMICGHVGMGGMFSHWIHSFNMPMFFAASGMFVDKSINTCRNFSVFVGKKAKGLLIPYYFSGFTHYLIWIVLMYCGINLGDTTSILKPLKHILLWNNNFSGLPLTGAPWFLTAIFCSFIIFYAISRVKIHWLRLLSVIFVSLFGCIYRLLNLPLLPFSLDAGFVGVGFLAFGALINKKVRLIESSKLWILIPLFGVGTLLSYVNGPVGMNSGEYSNILFFWIAAICLSLFFLVFAYRIDIAISKDNALPQKIKNAFIFVGKNSICYLLFNQLCISVNRRMLEIIHFPDSIYVRLIILAMTLVELYIITKVFISTRLKVLIGRF